MNAPTSRRLLLGASAAVAAIGGAGLARGACPTDDHPDAVLIAACYRFNVLAREISGKFMQGIGEDAWFGPDYIEDDDERDAVVRALELKQRPFVATICGTAPKTLAGARALATSLVLYDAALRREVEHEDDPANFLNQRITINLLRGLTDDLATIGGAS